MIYIIFLCSILIHEFGHILIAKILKIKINNIKFKLIGISAELKNENEINKFKKILIVLSGPIINMCIALLLILINLNFKYKNELIYTNLILSVFNLLPINPLDGGKLLLYILNLKCDFDKTFKIVRCISKLFLFVLSISYAIIIFIIKNIEIFFVIIYLWYLFIKEEKNIEWYIKINKNMRKYLNSDKKCAKIPSVIK